MSISVTGSLGVAISSSELKLWTLGEYKAVSATRSAYKRAVNFTASVLW